MTEVKTHYEGLITDTRRWLEFRHRPDDIFICTPPKSGTTWTQTICASLIFGTTDHGHNPASISPWVDAKLDPLDEYLKIIDAQEHRRFIKTHTPLDGIPFYPECQYIAVFRDPRDAYLSGNDHRDNMTNKELAQTFPSGDDEFAIWLTKDNAPGEWDNWTLSTLVHLYQTYWDARDEPNVHLFHYGDMMKDLPGSIARIARKLGYDYSESEISAFAEAASFDRMKSNAQKHAPQANVGFWKSDASFFATGGSRWQDMFSSDQNHAFYQRLRSQLDEEAAHWLMNGNG